MTRTEAAAAYQVRVQRRISTQHRSGKSTGVRGDTSTGHNFGPPSSGNHSWQSGLSAPSVQALPDHQSVVNRDLALNPLAGSFSPTVSHAAASD